MSDNGGTDSAEGTYGAVGVQSGTGSPGSAGSQANPFAGIGSGQIVFMGLDGRVMGSVSLTFDQLNSVFQAQVGQFKGPGPWADVKAWGAVGDGVTDDTEAVRAAVESLGLGGTVLFPLGTYVLSDTVTMPDSDLYVCFAPGCTVKLVGAMTAFLVPDGLTAYRTYRFDHPVVRGDAAVSQKLIEVATTTPFSPAVYLCYPSIKGVSKIFYVTGGDETYNYAHKLVIENGILTPPAGRTDNELVHMPLPHGNYPFGIGLFLVNVDGVGDSFVEGGYWTSDGDYDIVCEGNVSLMIHGDFQAAGVDVDGTLFVNTPPDDYLSTLYINAGSWWAQGKADYIGSYKVNFRINWNWYVCNGIWTTAKVTVDGYYVRLSHVWIGYSFISPQPAVALDILAKDQCTISDVVIGSTNATANIRNAGQRTSLTNIHFNTSGLTKTIMDVGAGDYTLAVGCHGLSGGGGTSLAAHSKATVGDYNFA